MIGKKVITIDDDMFLLGMTSSPSTSDGGFSPETTMVNPLISEGVLYAPPAPVNGDSDVIVAGNMIASCEDPNTLVNRYYIDTNGNYYSWNGTKLTLKTTDSTNTYIGGTSDFIPYNGSFFSTTANAATGDQVVMYDGATTLDKVWWHTTKSKSYLNLAVRHPLIVWNGKLYIGDKNKIHSWDGTTATEAVLTLSTEQSITALGIDPGSGKLLVSVSVGANYSNTLNTSAYIGIWDGLNPTGFVKPKFPVDEQINAFYTVGGTIFIAYGLSLGYFTGTGIKFIRKFRNVTLLGGNLAYKHHITNISRTLYIVDGYQILAFGEIVKNQPVFYYAFQNAPSGVNTNITNIANIGSGQLSIAYGTNKFVTLDLTSTASTSGMAFYSQYFSFGRPIELKTIKFFYNSDIGANVTPGSLSLINENGITSTAINITNNNVSAVRMIELPNIITKFEWVQLRYTESTGNPGLLMIEITYDILE